MARIAKSLDRLRSQINTRYPKRVKVSDGWIGDTAHAARPSDHNPNQSGVVQALDLTHDPEHGFDSWKFAETLRQHRDPRLKMVISNGRIFTTPGGIASPYPSKSLSGPPWTWRKYTGSNPHAKHIHISVINDPTKYDDNRPWTLEPSTEPSSPPPEVIPPGVTPEMRRLMAMKIIDFETDRNELGHLTINTASDGSYEVAGINSTYHKLTTDRIAALLRSGKYDEAEREVIKFILEYTSPVLSWTSSAGVEFMLRDTFYHRGPTGAAIIAQKAALVTEDGEVGPQTRAALAKVGTQMLLSRLRTSREVYEREKYGQRANLWPGLVNRWNKALASAQEFERKAPPTDAVIAAGGAVIGGASAATAVAAGLDAYVIIPLVMITIGLALAAVVAIKRRRR